MTSFVRILPFSNMAGSIYLQTLACLFSAVCTYHTITYIHLHLFSQLQCLHSVHPLISSRSCRAFFPSLRRTSCIHKRHPSIDRSYRDTNFISSLALTYRSFLRLDLIVLFYMPSHSSRRQIWILSGSFTWLGIRYQYLPGYLQHSSLWTWWVLTDGSSSGG